MKKTVFVAAVLAINLALFGCGVTDLAGSADKTEREEDASSSKKVVEFEDFLVERCVREALGKDWDEEITKKELASIEELAISYQQDMTLGPTLHSVGGAKYCGYVNLEDLKYLTGLEVLRIDFCSQYGNTVFENMDAIAHCRKLKSLTMPCSFPAIMKRSAI